VGGGGGGGVVCTQATLFPTVSNFDTIYRRATASSLWKSSESRVAQRLSLHKDGKNSLEFASFGFRATPGVAFRQGPLLSSPYVHAVSPSLRPVPLQETQSTGYAFWHSRGLFFVY